MATTILFLLRRGGSTRADADLVELWKVAFDSSPIAMLIRQNGVYVHCNDACIRILGARDKSHVLEGGPTKVVSERQPNGRLMADISKEMRGIAPARQAIPISGIGGPHSGYAQAPLRGYVLGADKVSQRARRPQLSRGCRANGSASPMKRGSRPSKPHGISRRRSAVSCSLWHRRLPRCGPRPRGCRPPSKDASAQATSVLATVGEASSNVQIVAAATEELSSSVSEIGRQVAQSTQIASQAVRRSEPDQCDGARSLLGRAKDRRRGQI